ncbi:MAG: ATP-grasp domain-containing protein [Acidobacteriota bacterium]
MNVLMISPSYPTEMSFFTRALAQAGATVIGVGDRPVTELSSMAREHLSHYIQVTFLGEPEQTIREILSSNDIAGIERIECLWEPCLLIAASLREALRLPGMTFAETIPFRDKDEMKRRVAEAGIRTPRHMRGSSVDDCLRAADYFGFPLVLKPISGAGSVDTYRVDDYDELGRTIEKMRHVPEMNIEEFIEGEEYTFDTICIDGEIVFESIAWYRPRPLVDRMVEWVSPQTIILRDIEQPQFRDGRAMGREVLQALGFRTGFSHMEWYLTDSGKAIFGEIGARPPGAHMVDLMNYASDIDLYRGWAEVVLAGRFSEVPERKYNSAIIVKRAQGEGRIRHVDGLEHVRSTLGDHLVEVNLLPLGAPRNDWRTSLVSDGFVILRHHDSAATFKMADFVASELHLYAG